MTSWSPRGKPYQLSYIYIYDLDIVFFYLLFIISIVVNYYAMSIMYWGLKLNYLTYLLHISSLSLSLSLSLEAQDFILHNLQKYNTFAFVHSVQSNQAYFIGFQPYLVTYPQRQHCFNSTKAYYYYYYISNNLHKYNPLSSHTLFNPPKLIPSYFNLI